MLAWSSPPHLAQRTVVKGMGVSCMSKEFEVRDVLHNTTFTRDTMQRDESSESGNNGRYEMRRCYRYAK